VLSEERRTIVITGDIRSVREIRRRIVIVVIRNMPGN